jgi:mannan endo-1,4-beta-mannosidase
MYQMKLLKYCAIMAAVVGFAACSDDEVVEPTPLSITSAEIEQVLEAGLYDGTNIKLTFSEDVTLPNEVVINLDGSLLTDTFKIVNNVATVKVNFDSQSTHTISVGRYAFRGATGSFLESTYDYTFTTEKYPIIVNNIGALSNASATQAAKNVYSYLIEQNGKKVLSGAMANVNNNNEFADWIYNITGKYPALTCYDFIHFHNSGENWIDYNDITPAITQWQNNGLVAYMWHWLVPSSEADYNAKNYSNYSYNNSFDVEAALTEGTWQNECINADIAQVAGYLKLLQDAGIPVIWRPLHEAAGDYTNGSWFWWGSKGVDATKKLWIYLHDKLTNEYGLNNLIWVWTAQTSDNGELATYSKVKAAYPGNDYVDIIGADIYANDDDSQLAIYQRLQQLSGGTKLVTISETGLVQSPEKSIADGAGWSYFMIWYTQDILSSSKTTDDFGNTAASLTNVFSSQYVINRDQMPSLK